MFSSVSVPAELSNQRFDKVVAELTPDLSRSKIKQLILLGKVLLNGEVTPPKQKVETGDEIEIFYTRQIETAWQPEKIAFEIIEETEDFVVVNKPANLVIHPGAGVQNGTLANGLLFKFPELENMVRAGIVHRLDKDTSGALIVAKKENFRLHFIHQLQVRAVKKEYLGFCIGNLRINSTIDSPIGRDKRNRTKMDCRDDGKEAITHLDLVENLGGYSVLRIRIETGRTHQIRVHLASKKMPLIGDKTYNRGKNCAKDTPVDIIDYIKSFPRQALHSHNIEFVDSVGKTYSFQSNLPEDLHSLNVKLQETYPK